MGQKVVLIGGRSRYVFFVDESLPLMVIASDGFPSERIVMEHTEELIQDRNRAKRRVLRSTTVDTRTGRVEHTEKVETNMEVLISNQHIKKFKVNKKRKKRGRRGDIYGRDKKYF